MTTNTMAGVTVVTVAVVIAATTVVTVEVAATPMLHNGLRLSIGVSHAAAGAHIIFLYYSTRESTR
jgi:hypothetical protein